MAKKVKQNQPGENKNLSPESKLQRRTLLKSLVGIPVLGAFVYEAFRKSAYEETKKTGLLKDIGLENINSPSIIKSPSVAKGDLIRIGIVGFGNRAVAHANGLGFMHPDDVKKQQEKKTLNTWLAQEDLNVAVVGVCDVFDLHAENGLATYRNPVRPGGVGVPLPVKRYLTYQEMMDDKNIDAIMVSTPDFHHAEITLAAAKAGKHVYCEKAATHNMDELYEVYDTVKNSKIVYQLGHQITQSAVFQQAKEVIKKNILGKITLIETTTNRNTADGAWIRNLDANGNPKPGDEKSIDWDQWLGKSPKVPFSLDRYYNWTKFFAYDIGLIGQLFTHEFDAVNQLLNIGIPQSVLSSGGIYYWKDNREIPDTLHCVFQYPNHDLTLLYSASLASSRERGRVFMGHDASMELGASMVVKADVDSTRYKDQIQKGTINPYVPIVSIGPGAWSVDALTSATAKYYISRGLGTTTINGKEVDVTHLHIKEWINCIRQGGTPSCNIERAWEEGVTCQMANISYLEKRRVEWDPVNKKII
jgi:predicted dehydrogenase